MGIGPISAANMQPSSIRSTIAAYIQQSAIKPFLVAYTTPTIRKYSSTTKLPVIIIAKTSHAPTFALGLLATANLSVLTQFASSIAFLKPSTPSPIDSSSIYSMQPSSTKAKPVVHMEILNIGPIYIIDT